MLYLANDFSRDQKVAIKMEKPDKSRSILVAEYQFLVKLRGLPGIINVIDFVSQ